MGEDKQFIHQYMDERGNFDFKRPIDKDIGRLWMERDFYKDNLREIFIFVCVGTFCSLLYIISLFLKHPGLRIGSISTMIFMYIISFINYFSGKKSLNSGEFEEDFKRRNDVRF